VLLYHSIADVASDPWAMHVTPQHFGEHLELLADRYTVIPLRALPDASASLSGRAVAITFDDGYANSLPAAQQLKRRGMPATMFVSVGAIGQRSEFWWDELERLLLESKPLPPLLELTVNGERRTWTLGSEMYDDGDVRTHREWRAWQDMCGPRQALYVSLWNLLHEMSAAEREETMTAIHAWAHRRPEVRTTHRLLSPEELGDLGRDDAIEIGAHGVTHTSLARLPASAQRDEVLGSKRTLERLLEKPVAMFAYPFGQQSDYTATTVELVRKSGYTHACSAVPARLDPTADPLQIPRLHVTDCNGERFAELLNVWFSTT
jgi:peptidoglycan/xylan/chitin deacetylase (PgdA/CDA1 family)